MSIVQNRKAFHDYFIEERYEAGLALDGWEVKAIRAGRAQLAEAYVFVRGAELFLIGAHVSPLPTVSTHFIPDPTRSRKLLMHGEEIKRLIGKVEQRGYTLVPLDLHYSKGRIKLEIALARGKLKHDKRAAEREKEWGRRSKGCYAAADFFCGAASASESHVDTTVSGLRDRLSMPCSISQRARSDGRKTCPQIPTYLPCLRQARIAMASMAFTRHRARRSSRPPGRSRGPARASAG